MTADEARGALYIDFEGLMKEPPCLLGILADDDLCQLVLDERLREAAMAKALEVRSFEEAIHDVVTRCKVEGRVLVDFSTHELIEIEKYAPKFFARAASYYRNGNAIVKQWMDKAVKRVRMKPGQPRGLKDYLTFLGRPTPRHFGDRKATKKITAVREMLERRGSWADLTPTKKRHWTILLEYNRFDCEGLRDIVAAAATDRKPRRGLLSRRA